MGTRTFRQWNKDLGKIIEAKNRAGMNVLIQY